MKLECDHGTYEADDEKALMKLVRAGAKRAAKIAEERKGKYDMACLKAQAQAYRILSRFVEGETHCPCGWRFYPTGNKYAAKVDILSTERIALNVECEGGRSKAEYYGVRILGTVMSGAGFTIAVFLQDKFSGEESAVAVAVHDDEFAYAVLPNVRPAWFLRDKDEDAVA